MMTRDGLSGIVIVLALTACGGGNNSGSGTESEPGTENEESTTDTSARFPASFANRISRINIDFDNDGTIDRVQSYTYDEQGRITSETLEGEDGGVTSTDTYIYSGDNLVQVNQNDDVIQTYIYENDRVVSRQLTDLFDQSSFETFYQYDDNGRLVGTTGETDIYEEDECRLVGEALESPAQLSIQYAGDRVSSIESDNGEYTLSFTYDSDSRLTQITQSYSCNDFPDITRLTYDSDGRISAYTTQDMFASSTFDVSYDSAGRVNRTIDIDLDFSGMPELTRTIDYIYNDQGLNTVQDSTTVDLDPGFLTTPSFIATLEYDDESCVTAIAVEPLRLVTLDAFAPVIVRDDPFLCTLPVN